MSYKTAPKGSRFVVVDDSGKVVDDAQGYGYKTAQNARKAMWYKFGGGQQKINKEKQEARNFWKGHRDLEKAITEAYEYNFKELARGEITEKDLLGYTCSELGAPIPPLNYLKYIE